MIDLNGITVEDSNAIVGTFNKTFWGSNTNAAIFLNKIGTLRKISGAGLTVTPGWAGVDLAQNRLPGVATTERDIHTYKKTVETESLDNSYGMSRDTLKVAEKFSDVAGEIVAQLSNRWAQSLHAAAVEVMTANPGGFGIFSAGYDTNTFGGSALYANSHFGGALDNIAPKTGATAANVTNDFHVAWTQAMGAQNPGTSSYYWAGVPMSSLDLVIMYPLAMHEVMINVFGAEQFMSTIGGAVFNNPQSNILAGTQETIMKKPELIPSPFLTGTDWYIFFTSKSISPSEQALQFLFNPMVSPFGQKPEALAKGVPVAIGDNGVGGLFSLGILGENSEMWHRENRALVTSKSEVGCFGCNPFRTVKIA